MGVSVESPVSIVNVAFQQGPTCLVGNDYQKYLLSPAALPNGGIDEEVNINEGNLAAAVGGTDVSGQTLSPEGKLDSISEKDDVAAVTAKASEEEEEDDDYDCKDERWEFPEDVRDYGVDLKDVVTPDRWVKRHPELVRLTGSHPFNCEPPLQRLMQHGFLTPASLHYVRNHSYVPPAVYDEWRVEVTGLVKYPQVFSMRQIVEEFTPRQLPVTLVCAGNRRKEQNMVRKTIGFHWGPAGIGTSVWQGARLYDMLRRCGIYSRKRGALHVCFEGMENLPGETKYGTSIPVETAMDESRDILVAYLQNGKQLEPDHGFPVRMIIPGFIGGRMVKWVTRIRVTSEESNNHYHYHDNRVLPSHVDAEVADTEGWWYKPEYIINDLNINSVITTPSHGEILPINTVSLTSPFTVKGYAYTGGGRKVTRVELTIDGGQTWRLCEIDWPEKPTKYGKHWCWCFWSLNVEVMELMQGKEMAIRAWDESMNTQPENLTWNVMGMMNNCWFRVQVSPCKPKDGGLGLIFEHPTRPGSQSGGWMTRSNDESKKIVEAAVKSKSAITKSVSSPFLGKNVRQITMAEVRKHSTPESPWIVVHNKVYDCTDFLKEHPGGKDSILINAGSDCTDDFDAIHSEKAKQLLEDFKIGEVATYNSDSTPENSIHGSSRAIGQLLPIKEVSLMRPAVALDPKQKIKCALSEKRILSHDVCVLRFALPSPNLILGLPVGKHMFVSSSVGGKVCMRAYTPITSDEEVGFFELLIKVYRRGVHPKFPEGGLMSQYLDSLSIGDTIDVKGPVGHIQYEGRGHVSVDSKPPIFMKRCAMLAGGTGITPMYQLIKAILKDPEDNTQIYLVFANRTEDDIILRKELDTWAQQHPSRFKVWYVIEKAMKEGWGYTTGFITEEVVRAHLPEGDAETIAFMCGPPPMIQFACLPNLEKVGYDKNLCLQF